MNVMQIFKNFVILFVGFQLGFMVNNILTPKLQQDYKISTISCNCNFSTISNQQSTTGEVFLKESFQQFQTELSNHQTIEATNSNGKNENSTQIFSQTRTENHATHSQR